MYSGTDLTFPNPLLVFSPIMCGIAGFFGRSPSPGFIDHALRALASRGPDGSGVWRSDDHGVALIHTRLAILDLTDAGSQPMEFEEKPESENSNRAEREQFSQLSTFDIPRSSSVLVFNGEIYNYRELRRELEAEGERFSSDGDTEVLLRMLVREGAACLPKLAGMFAFAFWNQSTGEALLARDPLGIKPLYYREDAGALAFSSDTRVLTRSGDPIDPQALRDYFLWGSVPDPQTLRLPVRQVPAGHLLRWTDSRVVEECWNRLSLGNQKSTGTSGRMSKTAATQAAQITRVALEESVRRHLVSDVPVGIFLSGGVDSTVLLALTRQALGAEADIRTFSIGFDDPAFDESGIARRTARHFGAVHTEWRMTAAEGADEISEFLKSIDQPGIDGFNSWCVSKLARREGMKVVLSGLGGDELFAGYSSFDRIPKFKRWHRAMGPLKPLLAMVLDSKPVGSPLRRLADYLRSGGGWLEAYHVQRGIFTPREAELLAGHLAASAPAMDWAVPGLPEDPLDAVSLLEISRYMRFQLLRDGDVYSMAHGLELRVPFVDMRLINTLAELPAAIRLRQGKQLLLEAVPEIPDWVRNQPKRGFRFPFQDWMESGFSDVLDAANRRSPVPLKAWYRTWAVAAAMSVIEGRA